MIAGIILVLILADQHQPGVFKKSQLRKAEIDRKKDTYAQQQIRKYKRTAQKAIKRVQK